MVLERGKDYSMYGLFNFFGLDFLNTGVIVFHNEEMVEAVRKYGYKKIHSFRNTKFAISLFSFEV